MFHFLSVFTSNQAFRLMSHFLFLWFTLYVAWPLLSLLLTPHEANRHAAKRHNKQDKQDKLRCEFGFCFQGLCVDGTGRRGQEVSWSRHLISVQPSQILTVNSLKSAAEPSQFMFTRFNDELIQTWTHVLTDLKHCQMFCEHKLKTNFPLIICFNRPQHILTSTSTSNRYTP